MSLNLTHIAAALLRGVLILWVLSKGAGLIVVALIAVGVNLVRQLGCAYLVIWGTPLRLSVRYLDRSMLDKLINYSTVAIAIFIGENLRFQSDAIVIGAFLSSAAITYFAIGSKLVGGTLQALLSAWLTIFTPIASHYDARGDREALQKVFVASNRACAFVIFPICAALIIMGKSIIQLWVGPRYLPSYFIRVVLILPKSLLLAQAGSIRILLGIGRQHLLALMSCSKAWPIFRTQYTAAAALGHSGSGSRNRRPSGLHQFVFLTPSSLRDIGHARSSPSCAEPTWRRWY